MKMAKERYEALPCWHGYWYVHDNQSGCPAPGWEDRSDNTPHAAQQAAEALNAALREREEGDRG